MLTSRSASLTARVVPALATVAVALTGRLGHGARTGDRWNIGGSKRTVGFPPRELYELQVRNRSDQDSRQSQDALPDSCGIREPLDIGPAPARFRASPS